MSINRQCYISLIIFSILLIFSGRTFGETINLRPVNIQVIDEKTGKPIEGIIINHIVLRETQRTAGLGGLPPVESYVKSEIVVKQSSQTDENGKVTFEPGNIKLRNYYIRSRVDVIKSELFFINLTPSDTARSYLSYNKNENPDKYELLDRNLPELDLTINPNKKYKGALLTLVDIKHAHERIEKEVTVRYVPYKFVRNNTETYTVALRIR